MILNKETVFIINILFQYSHGIISNVCNVKISEPSALFELNTTTTCQCDETDDWAYYYNIGWESPKGMEVRRYIISINNNVRKICKTVNRRVRNIYFLKKDGFVEKQVYSIRVFAVTFPGNQMRNNVVIKSVAKPCPLKLQLSQPLMNRKISVGEDITFVCNFSANPTPEVEWQFSRNKIDCIGRRILFNGPHTEILEGGKYLKVIKATSKDNGCYICYLTQKCSYTPKSNIRYLTVTAKARAGLPWWKPAIGGVGVAFFLIVLFSIGYKRCYLKKSNVYNDLEIENPEGYVYVSHFTLSENKQLRLLHLITFIQSAGIRVFIDLCDQVTINRMGGMAHWVPKHMSKADKIMIILTNDYIKHLNTSKEGDKLMDNIRKINLEYKYLSNLLYHGYQVLPRVIIVSDGVEADRFPTAFRGRPYFEFPKDLQDLDDDRLVAILGVLKGLEPLQLPATNAENNYVI